MIKEELETKAQQIERSNDPDLARAVLHAKAWILSSVGRPDACGTAVLSTLIIADFEKIEIILASGNTNYKFEAIMKVLLNQYHTATQHKENLLITACQMLVSVTKS